MRLISKTFLWSFVGLMSVALCLWWGIQKSEAQPDKKNAPAITVEIMPVRQGSIQQTLDLTAEVRSDKSVQLKSEISGLVQALHFNEGDRVEKGQLLFSIQSESENARVQQEKANLALKQATLRRVESLYKDGIVSGQKYDEAQSDLKLAKANLDFALAELNKRMIRAPFSGVVGLRAVTTGELVDNGTLLVSLNDNSNLKIILAIPEALKASITESTIVEIVADDNKKISVPIDLIEQNVNPNSRTINAQINLDQTKSETNLNLVAGQFVKVKIPTQKIEMATIIPERALIPRGNKTFVYAIKNNPNTKAITKARLVPVKILLRTDREVAVEADLEINEQVVTAGQQKLRGDTVDVMIKEARVIEMIPSAVETIQRGNQ